MVLERNAVASTCKEKEENETKSNAKDMNETKNYDASDLDIECSMYKDHTDGLVFARKVYRIASIITEPYDIIQSQVTDNLSLLLMELAGSEYIIKCFSVGTPTSSLSYDPTVIAMKPVMC